jgi:hypothetical protein
MSFEEFLVASVAIVGGLGIAALAIVLGIRHDWRKRELEHLERMRALELGRRLPQDEPWLSPAKIGAAVAILVPIGAFISVYRATEVAGYHEPMWIAVVLVGMAAVITGGSVVVATSPKKGATPSEMATAKPIIEEDAYDVVSSRG